MMKILKILLWFFVVFLVCLFVSILPSYEQNLILDGCDDFCVVEVGKDLHTMNLTKRDYLMNQCIETCKIFNDYDLK